ncbi:MAG: hypothetical protein SNH79_01455 [Rikenellaceae bacterium]
MLHIAALAVLTLLASGCETEYIYDNWGEILTPGGFYNTITTSAEVTAIGEYSYSQKGTIIPIYYKQTNTISLEFVDVSFAPEMEPVSFTIADLNESPSLENYYSGSNLKPIMNGAQLTNYNITDIGVLYDDLTPDLKVRFYCITDAPTYGAARYEVYFSYRD